MIMKLYNDDCLNILPTIPDQSVDLILCDLPYGITGNKWDCPLDLPTLWQQYKRIIKPSGNIILFSVGMFTVDLILSNKAQFRYKLIWKKNVPTGMASAKYRPMKYYEEILVFGNSRGVYNPIMKPRVGAKKECYKYDHYCNPNNHIQVNKIKKRYNPDFVQPSDVLEFNVVPNRRGKTHPTEKPVPLLEWLIKTYSNSGSVVLDSCMGTGSTGVACHNTGRDFIGIEKEANYFLIACNKLNKQEI